MRKAFVAALAVGAALPLASPAWAAEDAFNSQGLRKAVTLEGVREHQTALQAVADANNGTRASGTPGYAASAAYVRERLENAGYEVTEQQFSFPWATTDQSRLLRLSPDPRPTRRGHRLPPLQHRDDQRHRARQRQAPPLSQSGCTAADFTGFTPGNIALIERGRPAVASTRRRPTRRPRARSAC